jgi:hypothetical protein
LPNGTVSITATALTMLESGFDMAGHFVRDIAVLALVFIPIDLWKKDDMTSNHVLLLALASAGVFGFGVALHWVSELVKWASEIWREENMR